MGHMMYIMYMYILYYDMLAIRCSTYKLYDIVFVSGMISICGLNGIVSVSRTLLMCLQEEIP